MPPHQFGEVKPGDFAILHSPATADHHPVGAMRAAQDQRRQRIAAAGKARFVECEQRQIGLRA